MTSLSRTSRTLILVRHGLTDWNVERRYQGRFDIPLNAAGRAQAETLKEQLKSIPFDHLYSSPLRRALETASIIAGGQTIECDDRLAEIDHGVWQGKTHDEIAALWPRDWQTWNTDPGNFTPPGGESVSDLRSRVNAFIGDMQGEAILCVSHGVVIQTFLSTVSGAVTSAQQVPSNGSLQILQLDEIHG
ncbi:MAG TPA: histidine phosphatase family protein [Terriglobia bacterium]|jgi:broad specificity phosphatase PhoE